MLNLIELKAEDNALDMKVFSALFYATSSLMMTVMNKIILSGYKFTSFQVLGLGQIMTTIIALWIGRHRQMVWMPSLNSSVVQRIWPLPLYSLGNMATGFNGAMDANLPTFTVLRRVSILITMVLEKITLGIQATCSVQSSVMAMVGGAVIATGAADNDTLSWSEHILILLNNAYFAAIGIHMKKILDSKELGMCGLLYYDSLFMFIPALVAAWGTDNYTSLANYEYWDDPLFLGHFLMSCIMGLVLSYSMILCIQNNSALTTIVVGSLINILRYLFTKLEVLIKDRNEFPWLNFVGLIISVFGSLLFIYITFKRKPSDS